MGQAGVGRTACLWVNVWLLARTRETDTLAMLEAAATPTTGTTFDTLSAGDSVQALHDQIERMQAQIKFEQTRNEALNF